MTKFMALPYKFTAFFKFKWIASAFSTPRNDGFLALFARLEKSRNDEFSRFLSILKFTKNPFKNQIKAKNVRKKP